MLKVRIDWHVKRPASNTVKRSGCCICLGTERAAARAGNQQFGMRAPGSEQGRPGASRATPAIRVHAATVLGALEQLAAWSWYLRLRTQWGSSRVHEISRHQAQSKNTPMKCKAAVAILASESLALGSVSRQHARKSFVPQCTLEFGVRE